MSETAKTRHIVAPFCQGNGVDLGSGGDPIVPWAIQFDLHRHHKPPAPPVQFVWSVRDPSPFNSGTLDFVYASHILEDFAFEYWEPILLDWTRLIRREGHLIIQLPDHDRYRAAVAAGQPDNLAHKHESRPGELTELFRKNMWPTWRVLRDDFEPADDYNILFIAKRL